MKQGSKYVKVVRHYQIDIMLDIIGYLETFKVPCSTKQSHVNNSTKNFFTTKVDSSI